MSQTDKHKAVSGKKARKGPGEATPSPVSSAPMQARDAADKKAMEVHDTVQDLHRRNGELEVQVGELDAELKKSREASRGAEARATELSAQAARLPVLEQELSALRKQLEHVQTWSAEMSAQAAKIPALEKEAAELRDRAEKAVESERAARAELDQAHERHVTVIRAKDEKVAALENRATEGLKRLKDAHDSALRDEAARATAAERATRGELKKLQALHEAVMREAGPLRLQVAELRVQVDKAAELHKDIDALSQQVGQAVGARDRIRRELDESRSLLNHTREELRKSQDLRDESERGSAALRVKIADLERKAREDDPRLVALRDNLKKTQDQRDAALRQTAELDRKVREISKEDTRIAGLQMDLTALREEVRKSQELRDAAERDRAALRTQVGDLERRTKDDPRLAGLQRDLAAMKSRAEKAEAKSAESVRYFESIEKELVAALAEAEKAEALRSEIEKLKEECREHEEGLDQLSETVMELQHLLDLASEAKPEAPAVAAAPPPPAPVVQAAPPPAPKPEAIQIEIDRELGFPKSPPVVVSAPSPAPPGARAPVVVPAAVVVPSAATVETTLRPNHAFGPNGDDGQPLYLLHEMRPNDLMGVIYRATERSTGRAFAVRFMAGQAGEDQTRAFEKEVEKLISLPHPNILHVQGTGRRKNRLYVMMDLVDAPSLAAAKITEMTRICAIVRDAASAVHYAHEEGIFHGNLTPENILVGKEDEKDLALVKDFGLACLLETQTAGLRHPAFLPPEQVRVLKAPLSAAVDVYGLGATLFAALTGRPPFEGKDAVQIAKRVMIEEPPPVEKFRSDVPKAVSAVVRRAMAKERGVRYAAAQEMADALTKFLDAR